MPQGTGQPGGFGQRNTRRAAAGKSIHLSAFSCSGTRRGGHAADESLPCSRPSSCRPALRLRRSSRGRATPEIRLSRRRRFTGRIRADAPGAGTPDFPQSVPTSHGRHRATRRQAQSIPPSKNVDALPPKIREERVVNRKRRRIVRLRRVSLSGPTSFSACRPGVPAPLQAYPSFWQSAVGCTGFPAP